MERPPLYFIGPRSENRPFMAELMNLVLNDHVFWRRNYHPQDPAVISYSELKNKKNNDFQEGLVNELFKLMAELKLDPPFFSPRYMAHMISEPLLPGLIAYMATLFYNPNNVASEASTVTMKYEMEIGAQLARLFGFNHKESFGHLTGGGTVANYQSLFYNINLRLLPLSMFLALKGHEIPPSECGLPKTLIELCNVPYEDYADLLDRFKALCEKNQLTTEIIEKYRYAFQGVRGMDRLAYKVFGRPVPEIKIFAPASHHYSWSRGAKLLGLGRASLVEIKMDAQFQMDTNDLQKRLQECAENQEIILQAVSVYGTTELGSFDPINEIVKIRESFKTKGLYFPIHVDAAYGGYFSTLFVENTSSNKTSGFEQLKKKHDALKACESITVDPHKLGYSPYGAGAFIFKLGSLKEFVTESASYCFSPKGDAEEVEQLGMYILEGSKPGAVAAAVYFNHKIVPLNYGGYGKILENLSQTGDSFYRKLKSFDHEHYRIEPLSRPQSNIVCFYVVPKSKETVSAAHELTSGLAASFGIKDIKGVQEYDYIVSNTTISFDHFSKLPEGLNTIEIDSQKLCLMRMVFMNQWHEQEIKNGKNHLDLFLEKLEEELDNLGDNYERTRAEKRRKEERRTGQGSGQGAKAAL